MVELNPPKGYDEQSRSHLKNIIGLVSTVVLNSFVLCAFFLMNKVVLCQLSQLICKVYHRKGV